MTVKDLEQYFDSILSRSMSSEWDNDGLMLCTDSLHEVKKALLTLDVTVQAVSTAIELGVDAIFTHHPFIFKPMKSICDYDSRSKLIFELATHNIAVFSYHTRLDGAEGGVNDILASLLSVENVDTLGEGELAIARIGNITECTLDELAYSIKTLLDAPIVCTASSCNTANKIRRVAILGGALDREYVCAAREQGADAIITGDASYNLILDANLDGISVICAGHYASENPILSFFEKELSMNHIKSFKYNCSYFKYI